MSAAKAAATVASAVDVADAGAVGGAPELCDAVAAEGDGVTTTTDGPCTMRRSNAKAISAADDDVTPLPTALVALALALGAANRLFCR